MADTHTMLTEDTGTDVGRHARPDGDVEVAWPASTTHWGRMAVVLVAFLLVIGIGTWQFVDLHHQVHQLQQTTQSQSQQISRQDQQLSSLRNAVSAAVSCLETPQVQTGLCVHFLR